MKCLALIAILFISTTAFAAEDQSILSDFLEKNEPWASQVYCRQNDGAPECRSIVLYADKESSFPVEGFQISFWAPARPLAATEIFVPTKDVENNSGEFYRFVDNTMSGTFTISESGTQSVVFDGDTITIQGLPFGDLVFGDENSKVVLKNGESIIYPIVD